MSTTTTSSDANITLTNNDSPTIEVDIDHPEVKNEKVGNNDRPQVRKLELILMMLGLSFGVFLAALDQTIVSTALPAIASDFKALDQVSWVATSYLLTSTGILPTYGKFSDIFGRKATFLFALIVFEIGSLICGLAPNMTIMIIARAIAGIGGGGIINLVMVIISDIVSPQDNGKYQGIIGAIFGIASVAGSLLSRVFTDHASWRWIFYINIPLGAIAIIIVIFLLHMPRPKSSLLHKLKKIDYFGTIVVVGSTVTLLLALSWGGNKYDWKSLTIMALSLVGFNGYFLFAYIEVKFASEPIAHLGLFKNSNLAGCYATNFFQGMVFFGSIYYLPLYFQVVKGESATMSVLELAPLVLGVVVSSIVIGQMVSRTDVVSYRTICLVGAALMIIGAVFTSLWDQNTGGAAQFGFMIITGIGIGSIMNMTLLCAQEIVEHKDFATVTSFLMFFRLIGGIFGITLIGTMFSNNLVSNLRKASISSDYIEAVKQSAVIVNQLPEEIRIPIITAYINSLRIAFIIIIPLSALCFISSILIGNHKPRIGSDEKTTV